MELGFILDDLLSADLNKLIQQAGDNQMDAVRHRAAVSSLHLSLHPCFCQCVCMCACLCVCMCYNRIDAVRHRAAMGTGYGKIK